MGCLVQSTLWVGLSCWTTYVRGDTSSGDGPPTLHISARADVQELLGG